ncbi:MAG: rpfG7 [Clostridiaceae bacterium]|jgi:diguanylate cyclase (GGDEF)-like protein/PAS domain S-box-containing protein|nr:rpfG7 [Clostridiaceae bacterium]
MEGEESNMEKNIEQSVLEKLPFAYAMHKIILNDDGNAVDYEYVEVNDAFENFTGLKKENIIGKKATDLLPNIKSYKFDWINYYGSIAINGGEREFEQCIEDLEKWYKVKVFSPAAGYFITFFIDITQELKERNLYKSILSSLEEGLLATDSDGNITMINEAAEKYSRLKKENTLKENIYSILKNCNEESIKEINNKILSVINTGNIIKDKEILINYNENNNSHNINLIYNIYPIKNQNQCIDGTVLSFLDVTDKVEKQNEIDYITYHDSLTGAYNRTFFTKEIKDINKIENLPISVIMGDVNGLKLTNDAFGHLLGDELLVNAARVMKKSCRENDLIVRWGGDEFIILLPKTNEEQVQRISERIKLECENKKIGSIDLSISLGYSTKNNMKEDIMKTINSSEEIMYRIKMIESKSQKSKTLKVIAQTLREKSLQDAHHAKNVSKVCTLIGEALDMSKKELSELEILGDIHDIGKVIINENVLNKAGSLTSEEWAEIKRHSEVGYHIALSSPDLSFLADSILTHHERYDGLGYPKGLKGEEIPLYARILCIADALDTIAGYRSYKNRMSKEDAVNEFKRLSGKQFDPEITVVFIDKVLDNQWINRIYFG